MSADRSIRRRGYRAYGSQNFERLPQIRHLDEETRVAIRALSCVLPFRVNRYVVDELIDWSRLPADPIYQLTFPQEGMLEPEDFARLRDRIRAGASPKELGAEAAEIQQRMNPHPAGQLHLNVPTLDGEVLPGLQHKYPQTVLFFPAAGQTCHAYCTYCFRWPQFVGLDDMKFASADVHDLLGYLRRHEEITDVLITGGDPLIMKTAVLRRIVEPLLEADLEHVHSLRIGTKAPATWPQRFVTDDDADDLLRLFGEVRASGRQLALMAHYSHPRELSTRVAREAVRRILDSGAVLRTQAPLIRHVNDGGDTWAQLWREQVRLGAVPYYMFVERDTGPKDYFEVPLARALRIFQHAYRQVSGLGRTVRGPSMSCTPGKVLVDGVAEIGGEKYFALKFLQARESAWVNRVFLARYDTEATWLHDLRPAFGKSEFFFERRIRELASLSRQAAQRRRRRRVGEAWGGDDLADAAS